MIKKYKEYFGLVKEDYPRRREKYKLSRDLVIAKEYLKYLENLKVSHDSRQLTIETKNSHIIGQSSVVISIVSLFIPLFADKLNDLHIVIKTLLLIVFIGLVLHFIMAIFHAIKMLQIEKSRYMEGATSTITKENRSTTELAFVNEQIKDLVLIINYNNSITNKSAANLVYATRSFKTGIGIFSAFILILLVSFWAVRKEVPVVSISNLKELKNEQMRNEQSIIKAQILQLQKMTDSLKSINHPDTTSKVLNSNKRP